MIILVLVSLLAVAKTVYWIYVWQLKEYRVDRMRDFLSTDSGQKMIYRNLFSVLDILLLSSAFVVLLTSSPLFELLLPVIMLGEIALYASRRSQFRPRFTVKAMGCSAATLFVVAFFVFTQAQSIAVISALCVPLYVALVVMLMQPVSIVAKKMVISVAKQHLQHITSQPIRIGITGSFGKTTTKEYLRAILSQKFRTVATPAHVNVDIGVARAILSSVHNDTEVLIVEMGAYKTGEIASICALVQPQIGIVTAIADQHLSLFGSVAAIQQAKGELVRALPTDGLCIVNADFPLALEAAEQWSAARVYTYSTTREANITVSNITTTQDTVSARYHGSRLDFSFTAPMHGEHLLSNLVAAITVAEHLGLSTEEILTGIQGISTLNGTMRLISKSNGVLIIDDHYNSNPDGFAAALRYMNTFRDHKKIVVTPGMLELGEASIERHREIGKRIAEVADECIITKTDFAEHILSGINSSSRTISTHLCATPAEAIEMLLAVPENSCILLEGRVHSRIIESLVP